jgi:3-dehydroquinate synthase
MQIVSRDEMDRHDRQLLNFGHTIGHALENHHQIPHGHAVSIGSVAACFLSEKIAGLSNNDTNRLIELLKRYSLPVKIETDYEQLYNAICLDKKREGNFIQFVLMDKIGNAFSKPIPLEFLKANLKKMV